MEIVGKVTQILPAQGGTSAATGKPWKVLTFIIETVDSQYPRKIAIEVFGEDRINANPVAIDQVYTISFDLESREFNGRWYTSARAWKIVPGMPQPVAQPVATGMAMPTVPTAAPMAAAAPAPSFDAAANNTLGDNTDLPF